MPDFSLFLKCALSACCPAAVLHPGVAMIEFRTVDCDTKQPIKAGYIDRGNIYSGGPRPGWGWQTYSTSASTVITPSGLCACHGGEGGGAYVVPTC